MVNILVNVALKEKWGKQCNEKYISVFFKLLSLSSTFSSVRPSLDGVVVAETTVSV